jgi:hypothetical protein
MGLFWPNNANFGGKNNNIGKAHRWLERKDTSLRGTFGTLLTDVIKESSYLNLPEIGVDGSSGF